jgi:O-antigen/teichoic acid export membrane protein
MAPRARSSYRPGVRFVGPILLAVLSVVAVGAGVVWLLAWEPGSKAGAVALVVGGLVAFVVAAFLLSRAFRGERPRRTLRPRGGAGTA